MREEDAEFLHKAKLNIHSVIVDFASDCSQLQTLKAGETTAALGMQLDVCSHRSMNVKSIMG